MSRSTYYYKPKEKQTNLVSKIEEIIIEYPRYGYRRVTHALRKNGIIVNHKVVLKLMKEHHLLCKKKSSRVAYTTDSNHDHPIYPNLIKDIVINGLNQVWVSDLTYIRILNRFVYLAVILDLYSRKAIGYAISTNVDTNLTLNALNMAIKERTSYDCCIHHSDRGVQYASHEYVNILIANNILISMSSKGNPYENAAAESFMKTLKCEEVYLKEYHTINDVVTNIIPFIRDVYNAKRLHSSLGYKSPDEFELTCL